MFKLLKYIFFTIIILILLGFAFFGYIHLVEPHMLHVENVIISTEKLAGKSLKIALFSDTHFSDSYTPEDFEEVITAINQQSPDLIIFCGDFFDDYDSFTGNVDDISKALSKLEASIGKYGVFGNHDYSGEAEWNYESILAEGGFVILKNEIANFEDLNLALVGIDDCLIGYGNIDICENINPELFNIIICHEPDVVDELLDNEYQFDFMMSGHTHGGQLNIPILTKNYLPPLGEKYVTGLYNLQNEKQIFVTKGLGTTMLPIRFRATPEICIFTIK